jgi:ATP-binding cassette subfamily C protein
MLIALLLAGAASGVSVSMLLPLLSIAIEQQTGSAALLPMPHSDKVSGFEGTVTAMLHATGISPTIGVLLAVMVGALTFKNLLILFAQKRIGYVVAQVATALRLELLRSILSARWEHFVRQPVGRLANAMASEPMRASEAYAKGMIVITVLIPGRYLYRCGDPGFVEGDTGELTGGRCHPRCLSFPGPYVAPCG